MINSSFRFGVLGSPIAHSLSPLLYRSAFDHYGLSFTFDSIEVTESDFANFISSRDFTWKGFAVTMPNKIAALRCADAASTASKTIGAANTLYQTEAGIWHADNTDIAGIVGAFNFLELPAKQRGQKLLILGAGGTARAVVYAAKDYAEEIILAVRNSAKAHDIVLLADKIGLKSTVIRLTPENIASYSSEVALIVSTLPAGLATEYAAEISLAPRYFDVIYHPWPTLSVQYCLQHSATSTVGGLTMLLFQALAQFTVMTGLSAPQEVMVQALASSTRLTVDMIDRSKSINKNSCKEK